MKVKKTPVFGLICITLLIIMIIDAPLWAIHDTSQTAIRTDLASEKTEHSRDSSRKTGGVSVSKVHTYSTLPPGDIQWLWISSGPDIDSTDSGIEVAAVDPFDEVVWSDEAHNMYSKFDFVRAERFVEGTGTYFEITNSEYLNITLTSRDPVHIRLESVPRLVSFFIENHSSAISTLFALSGFEPNTTYYRYQDGDLMEHFTTSSNGQYAYMQDLSQGHHVFIQEETSTLNIDSDYTFTEDLYEPIVVDADNIVIDGNGHTLQGPGSGYGFYLDSKSNVTIRNVTITGWTTGIILTTSPTHSSGHNRIVGNTLTQITMEGIRIIFSEHNRIAGNTLTHTKFGIWLSESSNNRIVDNTLTPTNSGIDLWKSSNNDISNNTLSNSTEWAFIWLMQSSYNSIEGNILTGKGTGFERSPIHGIILDESSNFNRIADNTITLPFKGIALRESSNNDLLSNTLTHSTYGFDLTSNAHNRIVGNTLINIDSGGIWLGVSTHNRIMDNTLTNTSGIALFSLSNNSIAGNTLTNSSGGIKLEESSNIDITYNIFTNIDGEGIELESSSNNDITNNTFTNITDDGIWLWKSSNNSIAGNTLTNTTKWGTGISLRLSSNNSIAGNTLTNIGNEGIRLVESSYNDIANNTLTDNYYGIELENSTHNVIYHNKLINNDIQAADSTPANNDWNHPDLLEGNYWSDYPGMDDGSGTDKHAIADDGIGDTDIPWPETGYDSYPLMLYQVFFLSNDYTFTEDLYESIVVTADNIVIEGNGYTLQGLGSGYGFYLNGVSNVTIRNVTVTGWTAGIYIESSSNNDIEGNTLTDIEESGIWLESSSNNNIEGNTLTDIEELGIGIGLESSSNNNIKGNTLTLTDIEELGIMGIGLNSSSNNNIAGNILTNIGWTGIGLNASSNYNSLSDNSLITTGTGIGLMDSANNHIAGNTITNTTQFGILLLEGSSNDIAGNTIVNTTGLGIGIGKSSNNRIAGNTLTNIYGPGIFHYGSTDDQLLDNTLTTTYFGIYLNDSANNRIAGNTLTNTAEVSIGLNGSLNNVIYHNNLIDNGIQASDTIPANNDWYHPSLQEGNYWSDYPGVDDGSGTDKHAIADDGIGDTDIPWPETDYDFYPLMNPRGGPDFVIYQKDISFTINTGEGITASNAKVTNIGTADFVGDVVVQFFEEDESTGNLIQIGNQTIVNLGYGKAKTVSVEWQPIRSRVVIVYVDPDNKIAELDETNNWAEKGIGGYTPVVQDVYSKFGVWVGNSVGTFLTDLDIFGISIDNTFTANVGDRDGAEDVKKVVFELNDKKQYNAHRRGDDPQSSRLWDCVLEMSDLQPGENTLKITATDAIGISSETKTVIIHTLGLPNWIKDDIKVSLALKIPLNQSGWKIEWDIIEQKISITKVIPSDKEPPLKNTRKPPETVPAAGGRDCSIETSFGIKLSYYIKTGEAKIEGGGEVKFNALGYRATGRITVHAYLKPDLSFDNATVAFYLKVPVFALSDKVNLWIVKVSFGIAFGAVIGIEVLIKAVEEGLKLMSALIDLGLWGIGWLKAKLDLGVIRAELYAGIYAEIHAIVKAWLEGADVKVKAWLEGGIGFRWNVKWYVNWISGKVSGKFNVSFQVGSPGEVNETMIEEPWSFVQDYTTIMDSRPRVAADANGKATMIWVQNRVGPDNRTYADISYAMWDGTDWGTPGYITHDAQPDFDPALTYDSEGNVIAVWSRILGDLETHTPDDPFGMLGTQEIVYAIWDRTTKTWSPPQQLTDDTCADGRAVVSAGPDGTALAIWVGDIDHNLTTTADMDLYYSIWDGTDWTPEAALTSNTVMDYSVSLAHDSKGNAIACWVRDRDGNLSTSFDTELRYARWDGTSWSPSHLVTELNETKQSPSITFDQNDNALVTWVGGDEITNRLYFTSRDKTTGTWSKPEIVQDDAIFIYHPAINVDPDNTAVIVWRGFEDDEAERLYYYTHNATEIYFDGEICYATKNLAQADVSWSEVKFLTSDNKTDWMASAVIIRGHSNDLLLVWDKEGVVEDLVHPIKPDLTLDSSDITFSNDYPSEGETIDIMARIRNIGDVGADNVRVDFYDGDPSNGGALIGTQFINYLPYDGEINITLPWVVEPGTTYIYVVIDSLDSISEIDETNNIAHNTISILPDLTVSTTNITYSPSDPLVGEPITIFTTIHNYGGTNAENVLVHFYSNDNQIGSQTISLLNANDYTTVSIEWTATTLYNNITVIIDPFNEIEEWDEENNIASTSISILSNLDLELTEMSLSAHLLLQGENVKITAEIQNLGSADINGVLVEFFDGNPFINGIPIFKETIYVTMGGTYTSSFVWTPSLGTRLVFVVVDNENLIAESNEINNALYDKLVVRGLADLSLLEEDIRAESGSIKINATVKNLGAAGATGVVVHLYDRGPAIGGILLDSQLISHIAAGGNGTAYLTLYEPPQTGSLYFVVDPENAINESDETNNKVETSLEMIESRPYPSVVRWILPVAVLVGVLVGVLVILRRRRKPPSAD